MFLAAQFQIPFRTWTGVNVPPPPPTNPIAASRQINWTKAGVVGGIPNRTGVCSTLSPGVSATTINSAIASCPSGQVVKLNAGTYNLTAGITFQGKNNVTLRGAGANQTFLVFTGDTSCNNLRSDICIAGSNNWEGGPQNTANWTAGYAVGTTSITLSNTTNIVPGSTFLILDQLDDTSDTGNVFVCATTGVCSTEGSGGGSRGGNRAQQQLVAVTGVSGSTVTISPGLYMPNWSSGKSPGAWWANTVISGDGIESLSVDHTNSNDQSGIAFMDATNSWVKDVRSITPNRNHVWFYAATHITVEDSYFYGTLNHASVSYGIEPFQSSDCLVQNNIIQHVASPLLPTASGSGNVYAYNFTIDDFYTPSPNFLLDSYQPHDAGGNMSLFEGNQIAAMRSDAIHGTHNFLTIFRNRILGTQAGSNNNTKPMGIESFGRYYNVVGNVLGTVGFHTQYQDLAPSGTNPNQSIYLLGWSGDVGTKAGNLVNDLLVISTLMRWGNYDTVNNATQWNSSEVPSTISPFPNPVPANHSLPNSLYLAGQPSWWVTPWGTPAWPAIGPDVTGGPGPGGHSYNIPAALCYQNTPATSGILNFEASNCYSGL